MTTKEKLMSYVYETPHNTNPHVVASFADKLLEEGGSGLPDPSELADGTALVTVNGEWIKSSGFGYFTRSDTLSISTILGLDIVPLRDGYSGVDLYNSQAGHGKYFFPGDTVHVKISFYGTTSFDDDVTFEGQPLSDLNAYIDDSKKLYFSISTGHVYFAFKTNPYVTIEISGYGFWYLIPHTFDETLIKESIPIPSPVGSPGGVIVSDGYGRYIKLDPPQSEDTYTLKYSGPTGCIWVKDADKVTIETSVTKWNTEVRAGEATPAITLPAPAGGIAEKLRYTFTAATANASFTAPAGYILGGSDGFAGLTAGNTLSLTDLTAGSIYECSFAVLDSSHIALIMTEWATA